MSNHPWFGTKKSMDFPVAKGETVTQSHADYCKKHGHAFQTINGEKQPYCPRCGEHRP